MIYHLAKKHSKQLLGLFMNAKYVTKTLTAFTICENISGNIMRQRGLGAQNIDVTPIMKIVDDSSLKQELQTRKHFLVDSEIENEGQRV